MTSKLPIIQIALPVPMHTVFDYLPGLDQDHAAIIPGIRVRVPFGRRSLIGIVIGKQAQTQLNPEKLKTILEIIDTLPILPTTSLQLLQWASAYYHYPLGEVLHGAIPPMLRRGKLAEISSKRKKQLDAENETLNELQQISLNSAQKSAVVELTQALGQFKAFALDGVTGSGKTEVYIDTIKQVLQRGQQALVLVPEIGLTPQTVARFQAQLSCPIKWIHSNLTERERADIWLMASQGLAKVIIGTRSAIFTPMPDLGIIIVDEEHDPSYKQQEGFRYSARDLAVTRAHFAAIPVILGSATLSLESQYNVMQHRYVPLNLPQRAGNALAPHLTIVDVRNEKLQEGLSAQLIQAMHAHLNRGKQILLFLNRRGFAPMLMCHHCGWVGTCDHCDTALVLHNAPYQLHCHYCEKIYPVPQTCPGCLGKQLIGVGLGTERIEKILKQQFADINVVRIDKDTTKGKNALAAFLEQLQSGEKSIFIGTQMLAKGHHYPNITLVGIIDVDGGLLSADIRASERMGQMITQVAGRAGRGNVKGEVLIQTRHPFHPLLQSLIKEGYRSFSQAVLAERKEAHWMPYTHMALLRAEAKDLQQSLDFLTQVRHTMSQLGQGIVTVLGPVVSPMQRKAGYYRTQLLFQSNNRKYLQQYLGQLTPKLDILARKKRVHWSLDVDPNDLF